MRETIELGSIVSLSGFIRIWLASEDNLGGDKGYIVMNKILYNVIQKRKKITKKVIYCFRKLKICF